MISCEDYIKHKYQLEVVYNLCNRRDLVRFQNRIIIDMNYNIGRPLTILEALSEHKFECDKPHNIEILSDDAKKILLDDKLVENWGNDKELEDLIEDY